MPIHPVRDLPALEPLSCQVDAGRFATTQEQAAGYVRNTTVKDALLAIVEDRDPQLALLIMLGSVEQQARLLGLGHVRLEVPA